MPQTSDMIQIFNKQALLTNVLNDFFVNARTKIFELDWLTTFYDTDFTEAEIANAIRDCDWDLELNESERYITEVE